LVVLQTSAQEEPFPPHPREPVARLRGGRIVTPVNQVLTPVGVQADLPEMRPHALALTPDGQLLATPGKTHELVIVSAASGAIRQRIPLALEPFPTSAPNPVSTHILKPDDKGQVSYTGLEFSPDGSRLYLANVNGSIKVFAIDANHYVRS